MAIDSGFAMAWRKLGVETVGDRALQIEALEKAYRHRDRLTERERLLAEAQFHYDVENEPRKAIAVFERMVDRDPSDSWALNNLGASYVEIGEWAEAENWVARSVAVDSTIKSITNVAFTQIQQGKLDEAAAARMPDLDDAQRAGLAHTMQQLMRRYDALFDQPMPFSMGWHQAPFDGEPAEPWQVHAHFAPPLLEATKRKFMVGYELLSEPQRDISAEDAAERLRAAVPAAETEVPATA